MITHEWTKQETDTMLQNLHIKPSVLAGIMPGKSHTEPRLTVIDGVTYEMEEI